MVEKNVSKIDGNKQETKQTNIIVSDQSPLTLCLNIQGRNIMEIPIIIPNLFFFGESKIRTNQTKSNTLPKKIPYASLLAKYPQQ